VKQGYKQVFRLSGANRRENRGMKKSFIVILAATVFILAVAFSAAACRSSEKPDSGIRGTAMLGPLSPVSREGETNDKPYADAVIIIRDAADGREAARTKTAGDGTFSVDLAAGSYTVEGVNPDGTALPYAAPTEVTVEEGKYTSITVSFDTGIR
jgi:hypothetical protein